MGTWVAETKGIVQDGSDTAFYRRRPEGPPGCSGACSRRRLRNKIGPMSYRRPIGTVARCSLRRSIPDGEFRTWKMFPGACVRKRGGLQGRAEGCAAHRHLLVEMLLEPACRRRLVKALQRGRAPWSGRALVEHSGVDR